MFSYSYFFLHKQFLNIFFKISSDLPLQNALPAHSSVKLSDGLNITSCKCDIGRGNESHKEIRLFLEIKRRSFKMREEIGCEIN
jgi:hypothetical protein